MKAQLRELVFAAKILQFCADIFAIFGLLLFGYIYMHSYKDAPEMALKDPFFVVTILIPFIPAAFLAYLASNKRKKIKALLEQMNK